MGKTIRPLFAGVREDSCKQCGRALPLQYSEDVCPACKEMNLFHDVKDYIRNNEVNEADVAEHFEISHTKVRQWIREGRIQYKDTDSGKISSVYCQICGKPLDFGSVCADCRHLQNLEVIAKAYKQEDGKMRFMDKKEAK
ncbi:MAG: FeoC-like transcriptional regulator [Eubacteriales bacterium]|nr:FeoC-like transcriptional regulator [Eubacteriales bacterium]